MVISPMKADTPAIRPNNAITQVMINNNMSSLCFTFLSFINVCYTQFPDRPQSHTGIICFVYCVVLFRCYL